MNLAIEARAKAGELLTAAELDELAATDVLSLGMLADDVRRARWGDSVTFTRVRELTGASDHAPVQSGAEVRMGHLPATLDEAAALVSHARLLAGPQLLSGFSLADIADRNWGDLVTVLKRLQAAGLNAIAEAPVDRVTDLAVFRATQEAGVPIRCLSLQKPITGGRTDYVLRVRAIVDAVPSIHAVAPLPREQSIAVPTTGYDDVRSVAMARLGVPAVKTIQVDWAQYGPKLAQVALTFGANDLDRVSTSDDESLGRRRTAVEDVRRNIEAAGFTPVDAAPVA